MITKEDKINAKKFSKDYKRKNIGLLIDGNDDYYNSYLAACEDKNKEIQKYKKYTKGLLNIFDFIKWVTKSKWKSVAGGWSMVTKNKHLLKTNEELFDMFLNKIKKKKNVTKNKKLR